MREDCAGEQCAGCEHGQRHCHRQRRLMDILQCKGVVIVTLSVFFIAMGVIRAAIFAVERHQKLAPGIE